MININNLIENKEAEKQSTFKHVASSIKESAEKQFLSLEEKNQIAANKNLIQRIIEVGLEQNGDLFLSNPPAEGKTNVFWIESIR